MFEIVMCPWATTVMFAGRQVSVSESSDYFTIVTNILDSSGAVIELSGEFDMNSRDELLQVLLTAIDAVRPHGVVVDLGRVTFIDSEAISAIVDSYTTAKAVGVSLRVRHARGVVYRVLDVLGLLDMLNHSPSDITTTGSKGPDT